MSVCMRMYVNVWKESQFIIELVNKISESNEIIKIFLSNKYLLTQPKAPAHTNALK